MTTPTRFRLVRFGVASRLTLGDLWGDFLELDMTPWDMPPA